MRSSLTPCSTSTLRTARARLKLSSRLTSGLPCGSAWPDDQHAQRGVGVEQRRHVADGEEAVGEHVGLPGRRRRRNARPADRTSCGSQPRAAPTLGACSQPRARAERRREERRGPPAGPVGIMRAVLPHRVAWAGGMGGLPPSGLPGPGGYGGSPWVGPCSVFGAAGGRQRLYHSRSASRRLLCYARPRCAIDPASRPLRLPAARRVGGLEAILADEDERRRARPRPARRPARAASRWLDDALGRSSPDLRRGFARALRRCWSGSRSSSSARRAG